MVRNTAWASLFGLALLTVGCTIGDQTATTPPPEQPPVPVAAASPAAANPTATLTASRLALILPTNPDVRRKELKSGRTDPFASVAPPPPVVNPPGQPGAGTRPGTGGSATSGTPNASGPVLPPLPQPTQAMGVKVSGIMLVSGLPRAIVSAPDESVSRTVAVGDSLSNGLVRVRAIDISRVDPVVILEQYGQEVEVAIGQSGVLVASAPTGPVPALFRVSN